MTCVCMSTKRDYSILSSADLYYTTEADSAQYRTFFILQMNIYEKIFKFNMNLILFFIFVLFLFFKNSLVLHASVKLFRYACICVKFVPFGPFQLKNKF